MLAPSEVTAEGMPPGERINPKHQSLVALNKKQRNAADILQEIDVITNPLKLQSTRILATGSSLTEVKRIHSEFFKNASFDGIAEHGEVLTPGRYVGAEEVEDDGVPFAEKREGLTRELATKFHKSEKRQAAIHDLPQSSLAMKSGTLVIGV